MTKFRTCSVTGKTFRRTASNYSIGTKNRAKVELIDSRLALLRTLDKERIGANLLRVVEINTTHL